MKVSIVVPVYNMESKLSSCIESLLNQTYNDLEIILVDDGSKDKSFELCNKYSEIDNRIHVYHTENMGSGPARNYGIKMAEGDYIYFPDSDDYLEANAIEVLMETIYAYKCDLIVFGYKSLYKNGKIKSIKQYEANTFDGGYVRKNYSKFFTGELEIKGAPWNKFFNLSIIKANKVEYPPLRRHQDEAFISRYVNYTKRVTFIEDVLYNYFINDLKTEWDKYPVNYLDSVKGLYYCRLDTVLTWNPSDKKAKEIVQREYICNVIKAMELTFSKKMSYGKHERREVIKRIIAEATLTCFNTVGHNMRYQNLVLQKVNYSKWVSLYNLLAFKVFVQKNFYIVFSIIKKLSL